MRVCLLSVFKATLLIVFEKNNLMFDVNINDRIFQVYKTKVTLPTLSAYHKRDIEIFDNENEIK